MSPASATQRAVDATLDHDVDRLFEGVTVQGSDQAGPGRVATPEHTQRELQRLFGEIAAHHAVLLRDFAMELTLSATNKQWAELCAPALESILRAAEGIEHEELARSLRQFEKRLDQARRGPGALINEQARSELLEAYGPLTKLLPEAFDLHRHRARREPIIVQTLLESVPGMSLVACDKIYAVGLSGLEALYAATPSDIASTTGLDEALCAKVVDRFATYRGARAERAEHAGETAERKHLAELVRRLRQRQADFRKAEAAEDLREKRRLRAARVELVHEMKLALAHLGQIDLIEEIKRIPVDAKIERVDEFLRHRAST